MHLVKQLTLGKKKPRSAKVGAARMAQNAQRTELILIFEKKKDFGLIFAIKKKTCWDSSQVLVDY